MMPLPWGSVLCSLVCSWRPWLINVTVLGFNGQSAGVVCAPTCICRHVQDTIPGHLRSSWGKELLWWGEEWEPSDGDSTQAVGSPSQPAARGEELLSANHWSCCSLTSRNQGLGKTRGKDSSCGAAQASCTGGGAWLSNGPRSRGCGRRASVQHHRSQEEKEFQSVGDGTRWLCAGETGSKVSGMYANQDPLVTLSHALVVFPHKKALLL